VGKKGGSERGLIQVGKGAMEPERGRARRERRRYRGGYMDKRSSKALECPKKKKQTNQLKKPHWGGKNWEVVIEP